jgi:hypothetical protein
VSEGSLYVLSPGCPIPYKRDGRISTFLERKEYTGLEKMLVRLARLEDLPALGHIHINAWQTAYKGMISPTVLDAIDRKHAFTDFSHPMCQ